MHSPIRPLAALAATAAVALLASDASAGLLVSSLPTDPNGHATDAWNSAGTYASSQTIAAQFTLAQDSMLDGFSVWGASSNLISPGLSNVAGVEVIVWNQDFSAQVLSASFTVAELVAAQTGQFTSNGGIQYKVSGAISGMLVAGTYNLNVGAMLIDSGGDALAWSTGTGGSLFANTFDAAGWFEDSGFSSPAFELTGAAVPAPAGACALAFAFLGSRRRRR